MPAITARLSTPAATASSMISAMKTEQCWPSDTPPPAASGDAFFTGGAPPYCDTVCEAQQSLLQFAAALLLYVILALAGTCCIAAVQGPDRFEVPKDAQGVTQ